MNILVIKHGSLGDIFLSVGAIQSIRQHYPDAKLFLLTQSNYKNILNKFPEVEVVFNLISCTNTVWPTSSKPALFALPIIPNPTIPIFIMTYPLYVLHKD